MILLAGAALFVRTLQNLQSLDPGFSRGGILLVDFGGRPGRRVPWWQRLFETVEYLEDNVRGLLPGFLADAGFVDVRPVHRRFPGVEYLAAEKPVPDTDK